VCVRKHARLPGHLAGFPQAVRDTCETITEATMKLYSEVLQTLPPTPAKFHYIFNLRDLSRIYEGLCLTTPELYTTVNSLVRVWRNECLRVFHDRLTTAEDKAHTEKLINTLVKKHWPASAAEASKDPILFGDFRNTIDETKPRIYEDVGGCVEQANKKTHRQNIPNVLFCVCLSYNT
jgi:dynein heavy chain